MGINFDRFKFLVVFPSETGHHDDFDIGEILVHVAGHLNTVHPRHIKIEGDKVNGCLGKNRKRIRS